MLATEFGSAAWRKVPVSVLQASKAGKGLSNSNSTVDRQHFEVCRAVDYRMAFTRNADFRLLTPNSSFRFLAVFLNIYFFSHDPYGDVALFLRS